MQERPERMHASVLDAELPDKLADKRCDFVDTTACRRPAGLRR